MEKIKTIQTTIDELACLQLNIMIEMSHAFGKDLKGADLIRAYKDILKETGKIDLKKMTREFHELLYVCETALDPDQE